MKNLAKRARVIQAIRTFFIDRDYLEVETPIRIPAPAPETYIDAVESNEWFLQTSPELCMKQLLSAGYPRIFQICKCFRNLERGDRHLPEFTLLEWYCAESDYLAQMELCEDMIRFVSLTVGNTETLVYQGEEIELKKPWRRITVETAFETYASLSMNQALAQNRYDEVMGCDIEPHLGRKKPVFLFDYPASRAALAKLKSDNHLLSERFELYIAGLELCNTFSELTDPDEQRRRFDEERSRRRDMGGLVYPMPEKFLASLAGMPDAAGSALGIDRLTMLFTDSTTVDAVTAFVPEEL
jgi:lysyl-tRNA synthetase class 2